MSNGQVYQTDSGYEHTAYMSGTTFSPSAIDLEGFDGVGGITRDQIASGVFDNARVYIFKCNYLSPVEDYEEIVLAFFGKTSLQDERYKIEGMSIVDTLNQSVGMTYTPSCRHRFGDADCGVLLAPITVSVALTHVTSGSIIRASSLGQPADYFAYGSATFTSGQNANLKPIEIKRHEADGTLELFDSAYYMPEVGDTISLIPGCRKRFSEDCQTKFGNAINFGGFPHMPTSSIYLTRGIK